MRELRFAELDAGDIREAICAWLRARGLEPAGGKWALQGEPVRVPLVAGGAAAAPPPQEMSKKRRVMPRGLWRSPYMRAIVEALRAGPQPRRALVAACYGSESDPRKAHLSGYLSRLMREKKVERIGTGLYRLMGASPKSK